MLNKYFVLLAALLTVCQLLSAQKISNLYMIIGNDLQISSPQEETQDPSELENYLETQPLPSALKLYSLSKIGQGLGHIDSHETLGLYLRGAVKDLEPFINLEAHWLGSSRWAGSAGLGTRYIDQEAQAVYGINGYYDYLYSEISTPQFSLGVEYNGRWLEVSGNYYWQIGQEKTIGKPKTRHYEGGYFSTCRQTYELINGWDAEIGTRWLKASPFNLYTGVGLYEYRYHKDNEKAFAGICYRVELSYLDRGLIGIVGTHDSMFGDKLQGIIEINFPFTSILAPRRQTIPFRPNTSCCWKTNF